MGETGGKDFVVAHPRPTPRPCRRPSLGAFEYQGQKCSAASRAFVPKSVWDVMGEEFLATVDSLTYGDVTDLSNFGGAVIDARSYAKNVAAIERARSTDGLTIAAGGTYDDSEGYFVRPTVVLGQDPSDDAFCSEYFGPFLAVHVYDDSRPARGPTSCGPSTRAPRTG